MKTIMCDSGMRWCCAENVPEKFEDACKELTNRGWKKVGWSGYWGWYCKYHAVEKAEERRVK